MRMQKSIPRWTSSAANTGHVQREGEVLCLQRTACASGDDQARAVGGNRTQLIPGVAREKVLGGLEQSVVGVAKERGGEALSRLAEGLGADTAHAADGALEACEQGVELGLDAGAQAADHHGGEGWKGERALAGEGRWAQAKLVSEKGVGEELTKNVQETFRFRILS